MAADTGKRTGPRVTRSPEHVEKALSAGTVASSLEEAFELAEEIGRGGMGAVLRGRDRLLNRNVAIKVLGEPKAADASIIRRFVVEAQLGAQLEHPNIVPFYGLYKQLGDKPAFAMKLVEGQDMADYLDACGATAEASRGAPYDLASRLEHFLKVCDAIEYANARGVVHRDLKPSNIMLGRHNEVYVMDWGVARVIDEAFTEDDVPQQSGLAPVGPQVSQAGEVLGSPAYMAPEQARSEEVSSASDQYALGMMLAEIVTLDSPRRGSTLQQLGAAMTSIAPKLTHRYGEPIARELVAIIQKATASKPEARYPSVAAFAADVRRFLRDEPVSVSHDPRWVTAWRFLKRRPLTVLSTLSLLALAVSVLALLSLARELGARSRAAAEAERSAALASAVARTGRGVDARFQRIELLVEVLSAASSETLRRPQKDRTKPLRPSDFLPEDSSAKWIDRYHQRVSFDRAVVVLAPDATDAAVAPVLSRLGDFETLLLQASARAATDDAILKEPAGTQRDVARQRSPILWADLAFESGAVLVYPANTFFPEGFDPRKRVWYTAAIDRYGYVWGAPYPDATSGQLLVACSRAFRDPGGKVAGVAAAHVRMDDIASVLAVPGVAGYRGTALVDETGTIVLSTDRPASPLPAGVHENRELERRPFPVAAVARAIAAGAREGRVVDGGALVVFERIQTGNWTVAVTVDAEPYAFR